NLHAQDPHMPILQIGLPNRRSEQISLRWSANPITLCDGHQIAFVTVTGQILMAVYIRPGTEWCRRGARVAAPRAASPGRTPRLAGSAGGGGDRGLCSCPHIGDAHRTNGD